MTQAPEGFHPGLARRALGVVQFLLDCLGDELPKRDATLCCFGLRLTKYGVGHFEGRLHEANSPIFVGVRSHLYRYTVYAPNPIERLASFDSSLKTPVPVGVIPLVTGPTTALTVIVWPTLAVLVQPTETIAYLGGAWHLCGLCRDCP